MLNAGSSPRTTDRCGRRSFAGDSSDAGQPAPSLESSFLAEPGPVGGLPGASGRQVHLADAKWTEPRSRDAASLRKVLNVLPTDAVESLSVVCRTPNEYPLTEDVDAVRWMR